MALSKRLRYEILRRDDYRCRYCGATPDQRELRVDHVVPVALGGRDEPGNLVCACEPCNSGKTSTSPDAPLVAQVADDALRWAKALELATAARVQDFEACLAHRQEFFRYWEQWDERQRHLPSDWCDTIDRFCVAGLPADVMGNLVHVAHTRENVFPDQTWRYFCGCCWTTITEIQDHAARIVADGEVA